MTERRNQAGSLNGRYLRIVCAGTVLLALIPGWFWSKVPPLIGSTASFGRLLGAFSKHYRYVYIDDLRSRGKQARENLPDLFHALADSDDGVRQIAAQAIGEIAIDLRIAGPELRKSLQDPSASVRTSAARAIRTIAHTVRQEERWNPAIRPEREPIGGQTSVLADLDEEARECQTAVRACLEDNSWEVRFQAALAIKMIDPDDSSVLAIILEGLAPTIPQYCWRSLDVARVLGVVDPDNPSILKAFMQNLRNTDPDIRQFTAQSLADLKSDRALPALVAALDDTDKGVRVLSIQAIEKLGPQAASSVPALKRSLHRGGQESDVAAQAIGQIGSAAQDAVPQLIVLLNKTENRLCAARALGRIGPSAASATAPLVTALSDEDSSLTKLVIIEALGRIGPTAIKVAEPKLQEIVRSGDILTRPAAAAALKSLAEE
jgi:HEAT repeat protein